MMAMKMVKFEQEVGLCHSFVEHLLIIAYKEKYATILQLCGFRSSMSTTESLLDLLEEITTSLENNKYAVGVFFDLKIHTHLIITYCVNNCISMVYVVSNRYGYTVIYKTESSLSVLTTVIQKYLMCHVVFLGVPF